MERPLTENIRSDGGEPAALAEYERTGGYAALRQALGRMTPAEVQKCVAESGLRGRGGAGFPTGKKWSFVPMGPGSARPKYLVVNGDEMEPGTFKDRRLMEGDPHGLLEGTIIAAYAIGAEVAYIFVRGEYRTAAARLARALAEARAAGYVGRNVAGSGYSLEIYLHVSAGRYMCGEEEGLLNALEGKRPTPRAKPPHPPVVGLWGKPTIVNNVETIACVRHIVSRGAAWFRGLGRGVEGGTKLYGASGHVRRPGLWELPMGTTAREIIEEYAGGMRDGWALRGFQPGGASTDFLTAVHLDAAMDFAGLERAGSRLGTGAIVVLDDRTCPVGFVANLLAFFARESCGWCTPCRDGLPWTARTLRAIEEGRGEPGDLALLEEHTRFLAPGNTFCALAPGAMEPLASALRHFRDDFERHIKAGQCPYRAKADGEDIR
jgi:NADH-quinone oxidoreductase subunit F